MTDTVGVCVAGSASGKVDTAYISLLREDLKDQMKDRIMASCVISFKRVALNYLFSCRLSSLEKRTEEKKIPKSHIIAMLWDRVQLSLSV